MRLRACVLPSSARFSEPWSTLRMLEERPGEDVAELLGITKNHAAGFSSSSQFRPFRMHAAAEAHFRFLAGFRSGIEMRPVAGIDAATEVPPCESG